MQRLILVGLTVCILLGAIGFAGLWYYRQNRPDSQWVPLPLNEETTKQDRMALQKSLSEALNKPEVIAKVAKDLQLASRWGVAEAEATQRLKGMLFVREGEFKHPQTMMTFATMDVGVKGKRKERALLGEISERLGKETRAILGVPEPK